MGHWMSATTTMLSLLHIQVTIYVNLRTPMHKNSSLYFPCVPMTQLSLLTYGLSSLNSTLTGLL